MPLLETAGTILTVAEIISKLADISRDIFDQNESEIFNAQVIQKLSSIERKINDQKISTLLLCRSALIDGIESKSKKSRDAAFSLAYAECTKLISYDVDATTIGTEYVIPNRNMIFFGYFGRHLYYREVEDYCRAALQVYAACEVDPILGVRVFDKCLFDSDYFMRISEIITDIKAFCGHSSAYPISQESYSALLMRLVNEVAHEIIRESQRKQSKPVRETSWATDTSISTISWLR